MRILIVVTMVIVFISAFFIMFTTQGMFTTQEVCYTDDCGFPIFSTIFGISTIVSFLLISILAVYIVSKTLSQADIGKN